MDIILIGIGLLLFICLVLVHEWGHYKAARLSGVEVEEFGLGFPPRVWEKKLKSGLLLTLNLLPLGGFVRLKGEHDSSKTKGSFGAARLRDKVRIMLAGVAMNLLVAVGLFTVLAFIGIPQIIPNQFMIDSDREIVKNNVIVGMVEKDSPAEKAGIATGDTIKSIKKNCDDVSCQQDEKTILNVQALKPAIESLLIAGHGPLIINLDRSGSAGLETVIVEPRTIEVVKASEETGEPVGYLGVVPTEYTVERASWSAPIVAFGLTAQITQETFKGLSNALSQLFRGNTSQASQQVSGPVGIFVLLKDGSQLGVEFTLFIIAIISLTLAIMNALPIPALDGGRLFVTLLYRLRKKILTQKTEERIHGIGFAVLMTLFVLITIVDIRRL